MSIALTTILGVALAGLLGIVQWQMNQFSRHLERIEDRLERLETRMSAVEVRLEHIDTKLDAHLSDHPPPGERLVH